MEPIVAIARAHDLVVVEDAAQAIGATYRGRGPGHWGEVACFSFYPGKNLGAYGDAGAVVNNDAERAARLRMLGDHGRKDKYVHELVGYGNRLDGLQAAILSVKLRHLPDWTRRRCQLAAAYRRALSSVPEVTTVQELPGSEPVYHLFVIECDRRDELQDALKRDGIGAGVHYPVPLHLQPALAYLGYREGGFPVSERLARRILSLPLYPELTEEQLSFVASRVAAFFGREATPL
jgi:dTDP-4-amino-4,6-dideoxygalactose transaminase